MATLRTTSAGAYVEQEPDKLARVTSAGAYAEVKPDAEIRATSVGAYIETNILNVLKATSVGAYVEVNELEVVQVTSVGAYVEKWLPEATGEDTYDPSGHRVVWGDSCISNTSSKAKVRVISPAAWLKGGAVDEGSDTSTVFVSRATVANGDDWSYQTVPDAPSICGYTRIGVYPSASEVNEEYYVWYVSGVYNLYRQLLTYNGSWSWGAVSAAQAVVGMDCVACHPISVTEAILVVYKQPYIWVRYVHYDEGTDQWTGSTSPWYVYAGGEEDLVWSAAHWSDAVISPHDSNVVVVAVNLSRWGSAQVLTYNIVSGVWSQTTEMMPSQEQWGNLKCLCAGLSVINNRIWAATVREPIGSDDTHMAHHVALMSSPTGEHWRDEDFTTISTLRGKVLYAPGEEYAYVAGNIAVARADATRKLGYDVADLKYQMDEVYEVTHRSSGPSSSPETTLRAKNVDDAISGSSLLESGNEIQVEVGATGAEYGDLANCVLSYPYRERSFTEDEVGLQCTGHMSKLVGSSAYRPPAAKVFDGPYSLYSRFSFDNGNARLTVRQETGSWVAKRVARFGRYILHCEEAGISLVPHAFQSQSVIARIVFQPTVSFEGVRFVFWWNNDEDYWTAGIHRTASTQWKLQIEHVCSEHDPVVYDSTLVSGLSAGLWYTMYLGTRSGSVSVYFNKPLGSGEPDFDLWPATASVTGVVPFSTTDFSDLEEHHIGLLVEDFMDFEGADIAGKIESAGTDYIEDTDMAFDSSVLGKWLRCHDQDRQIVDFEPTKLIITPGWSELPEVDDPYGVYTEDSKDGPGCYFSELWVCEGIIPYTVDDVLNSMLELCGVSVTDVFTATSIGVGPTGGAPGEGISMNDIDVRYTADTVSVWLDFWASTQEVTGEEAASCLVLGTQPSSCSLWAQVGQGSAQAPYIEVLTEAVHPTVIEYPANGKMRELRVQANHKFIVVSCDGHFLTAFPCYGYWYGGYVSRGTAGNAWTTEFRTILDSFIWDANEPASSALSRLLRGRRAKMIERSDGTISVSKFDVTMGDAGTYAVPVTRVLTGEVDEEVVSLVEMVGAEDRAFHIDPDAARKKLRYTRADNPTLDTQFAALVEGKKLTDLGRQRHKPGQIAFYIGDPSVELEDEFTVDGVKYIVEGVDLSLSAQEDGPQAAARITARQFPDRINSGKYNDGCEYDDGTEYS